MASLSKVFSCTDPTKTTMHTLGCNRIADLTQPLSRLVTRDRITLQLLAGSPIIIPVPTSMQQTQAQNFSRTILLTRTFPSIIISKLTHVHRAPPRTDLSHTQQLAGLTKIFQTGPRLSKQQILLVSSILAAKTAFQTTTATLGQTKIRRISKLTLTITSHSLPKT